MSIIFSVIFLFFEFQIIKNQNQSTKNAGVKPNSKKHIYGLLIMISLAGLWISSMHILFQKLKIKAKCLEVYRYGKTGCLLFIFNMLKMLKKTL
jgi:hypothetical protein